MTSVVSLFAYSTIPADGDVHPHPGPVSPTSTPTPAPPPTTQPSPLSQPLFSSTSSSQDTSAPLFDLPPIHRPCTRSRAASLAAMTTSGNQPTPDMSSEAELETSLISEGRLGTDSPADTSSPPIGWEGNPGVTSQPASSADTTWHDGSSHVNNNFLADPVVAGTFSDVSPITSSQPSGGGFLHSDNAGESFMAAGDDTVCGPRTSTQFPEHNDDQAAEEEEDEETNDAEYGEDYMYGECAHAPPPLLLIASRCFRR